MVKPRVTPQMLDAVRCVFDELGIQLTRIEPWDGDTHILVEFEPDMVALILPSITGELPAKELIAERIQNAANANT
jgi:hypothetical protein